VYDAQYWVLYFGRNGKAGIQLFMSWLAAANFLAFRVTNIILRIQVA
jgi:hypothetical protein